MTAQVEATVAGESPSRAARTRGDRLTAAAIFVGALALRLAHLAEIRTRDPFFERPSVDGRFYHEWARELSGGDWIGEGVFFLGPLYPYFLGLLYTLFGESLFLAKLVQTLLGAGSCVLVYWLAREIFDRRVAVLAGIGASVYSMSIFYEGTVMLVNLQVPLVLGIVLATVRALHEPAAWRWLLAGGLLGLSALARQTVLPYAAFVIVWLIARRGPSPGRRLAFAGAFSAGAILAIAPVTARNFAVSGDLVPVTSAGGYNLYMGNNPRATGVWNPPNLGTGTRVENPLAIRDGFARVAAEKVGRPLSPSEVSRYWAGEALAFAREEPGAWLRLELRKLLIFANAAEPWGNRSIEVSREFSRVLQLPLLSFGLVAPFGFLGIALTAGAWRRLVPLYAMLATYLAFGLAFFVLSRYRMPAVPLLLVFAAAGVVVLYDAARERRFVRLGIGLALLAGFALVTQLRVPTPNLAMAYYNLGNRYKAQERWEGAVESYMKALSINPQHASSWNNLALAWEGSGEHDAKAIETWRVLLAWAKQAPGREAYLERARRHLEGLGAGEPESEAGR